MKIGLDARWIFPEISGIGAYTTSLLSALVRQDQPHSFVVFFDNAEVLERTVDQTGMNQNPAFSPQLIAPGIFSVTGQLTMPGIIRQHDLDVFHSTNYMIPLLAFPPGRAGRTRCVVTIHDLIPLLFPDHAPRSKKTRLFPLYKRLMISIGRRADRIITDSQASRRDVLEQLRIPESRSDHVHTVYCGVGEDFVPPAKPDPDAERPGTRCILYVGRSDPYKNLTGLVTAFSRMLKRSPFPVKLVIAGSRDERYPDAPRIARELGIEEHIAWTGYIQQSELVRAYQEADLLVLPSRYEGFGLPVVEAMACDTPVVCSTAGSLPEVAGDAALRIDPDDLDGLARAMHDVLTDDALSERLREAGREQVKAFTWDKAARETLAIYEEL